MYFVTFFFFFAPFFLWLRAGWYTLHCLRNREYFFFLLCMYTSVPKPTWTLTDSCYPLLYMSIKSLFTIETIQLKSVKVPKSWKIPTEKFCRYRGLNPGLQLPIMSLMHILLKSIDADMKSEIGSSREGLRPYPLRFHVEEAGADAKLNQQWPLGIAYHCRHPISTVPVARITAHATVPGCTL